MRLNTIYRQGDTVGWRKPERNAHLAWTSSLCRCRKHWRLRQTLNLFCHSEPTLMCRRGCCSLKVSRAVFLGIVRRPQHGRVFALFALFASVFRSPSCRVRLQVPCAGHSHGRVVHFLQLFVAESGQRLRGAYSPSYTRKAAACSSGV